MAEPKILGTLRLCQEGERLFFLYADCLEDDELCFSQHMKDCFDKWIEHKNECPDCGYI